MKTRWTVGALAAGLLALVWTGVAEAKRAAVVLDSQGDDLSEPLVGSAAENALTRAGWSLLETAQLYAAAPEATKAVACNDDACRQKYLGKLTVDEVVLLRARFGKDLNGEPELWLSAWRVTPSDGATHGSTEARCEKCNAPNLIDYAVRDMIDRLVQENTALPLAAPKAGDGMLAPEGGTDTGPAVPTDAPGPRKRRFKVLKFIALGAGVAALGTGVALIAMDKGPIDDSGNQRKEYRESKTPGIILASAGGALVVTGVIMWILDGRSERRSTSAAVMVTPSGTVAAGIGGRF